ncbi:AmmeMemoRadiSam system protein B [Candidatus Margulisiibacteriota bacterium]
MKEPNVAGSFYPGEKKELFTAITKYFKKVSGVEEQQAPWALIAPHAGYMYSGQTAAYAYKALEGHKYDTVVVIAPAHFAMFDGIAIYPQGGFKTPLGEIPIDEEITAELIKSDPKLKENKAAFEKEHSLEVQLPFLQAVLTEFNLVPIVVGRVSYENVEILANALLPLLNKNKKVLIVASTDLAHYKPAEVNDALDQRAIKLIEKNDVKGILQSAGRGDCELCGLGGVATVMLMAKEQKSAVKVLKHSNSGDITGDYSAVVGYLAVAYYKNGGNEKNSSEDFNFSTKEQKVLLNLARDSISAKLKKKELPATELDNKKFQAIGAAFVTIHKKGQLRGCIGHVRAHKPLAATVQEMALAAAFEDPRFPPLRSEELKDIDIEISVLTPMRRISDIEEIDVGKHGLLITQGLSSGLLLPQVATEQGWDRAELLIGICRKAGLPPDAWQKGAVLHTFSAEVFHE